MKRILVILAFSFMVENIVYSQNSSSVSNSNTELFGFKRSDYLQLTIQSGFLHPLNPYFVNHNYTSSNLGFDLSYRVNTEVALFAEMRYNFLTSKDTAAPNSGYFETTLGARYYLLRPSCCRSSLFFESGVGPFLYIQREGKSYNGLNLNSVHPPVPGKESETVYKSERRLSVGANFGFGAELVLTNNLFITMKSKLNSVFESNGCTTYVTGMGGLTIKF
ncbi:MAG: hypothetical protein LWX07_05370 [Bacteroidetes bacterium]|nr:hypothetical protein [Bacteroidota bacterium]